MGLTLFFAWIVLLQLPVAPVNCAADSRYYPYSSLGPSDSAGQRFTYYNGTIDNFAELEAIGENAVYMPVYCTNPFIGGAWGCPLGYIGIAMLDFGHQTHDLISIAAALSPVWPPSPHA